MTIPSKNRKGPYRAISRPASIPCQWPNSRFARRYVSSTVPVPTQAWTTRMRETSAPMNIIRTPSR